MPAPGGGLIHRAAAQLFEARPASLRMSFAEIYNEKVGDLLAPDGRQLPIRHRWLQVSAAAAARCDTCRLSMRSRPPFA